MRLVADESVESSIVEALRLQGHDVLYVAEMAPGITDERVLSAADERRALLLTADRDFGELVFRQRLIHSGVILLRLSGLSNQNKGPLVAASLREHEDEMRGAFTVIAPGQVRIRPGS